jgi:uncharacterized Zn finger protein
VSDEESYIIFATACPSCGIDTVQARVSSAKVVGESWVASGRLVVKGLCPACGATFAAVKRAIPIQCEGLTCPVCRNAEHLTYEVTKVDNDALEFTATIKCTTCKKKRTVSKWLKKLLSIVTVKIGPLGISAKKESSEEDSE